MIRRSIAGYDNKYEVLENGEIYSLISGKILKQALSKTGYKMVSLESPKKTFLVHRLVAKAFIDSDTEKKDVNHIDGDKSNNNVSNLEWCNKSENTQHAISMGLIKRKVSDSTIDALLKRGLTHKAIAEELNISESVVAKVKKRLGYTILKPKRLCKNSKEAVINSIRKGVSVTDISIEFNLSDSYVRRLKKKHLEVA